MESEELGTTAAAEIMQSGCLYKLPDELIDEILSVDCLLPKDIIGFMVTCRRFCRIATPWLYHTFDVQQIRKTCSTTRILTGIFGRFALALAADPRNACYVRRISTIADFKLPHNWDRDDDHDLDYGVLMRAARKMPIFTNDTLLDLSYGMHYAQLLFILGLAPNITDLSFSSLGDRVMMAALRYIENALAVYAGTTFSVFPRLRKFTCRADWIHETASVGMVSAAIEETTFLLRLPSLRHFTATHANYEAYGLPTSVVKAWSFPVHCPPGLSPVTTLTFDSCDLPCAAFANIVMACQALESFTCRWRKGLQNVRLHFPDLRDALLCQKRSLRRLTLEVQGVQYAHPFQEGTLLPIECTWLDRAPLGSLRAFEKLRHVTIPALLLGSREQGVDNMAEMLPPSLESLAILDPLPELYHWDVSLRFCCSYPQRLRHWRVLDLTRIHNWDRMELIRQPLADINVHILPPCAE